jgi:hypothetical protein
VQLEGCGAGIEGGEGGGGACRGGGRSSKGPSAPAAPGGIIGNMHCFVPITVVLCNGLLAPVTNAVLPI